MICLVNTWLSAGLCTAVNNLRHCFLAIISFISALVTTVSVSTCLTAIYICFLSYHIEESKTKLVYTENNDSNIYNSNDQESKGPKLILFYNPSHFQIVRGLRKIINSHFFNKCSVKNCRMTFHRGAAQVSDAVIFHWLRIGSFPNYTRPQNQVWIFIQHEATSYYRNKRSTFLPGMMNAFNWTMTYSKRADLPLPYGRLRHKTEEAIPRRDYLQIAKNKSKDAIWVSSHCTTDSEREKYVTILKQYINIEVLGACGRKWKCGKALDDHETANCFSILNSTYRYYLAFENAICEEYITEKFFQTYKYDILQIVRGGDPKVRPINIDEDAYISTSDFKNAHELGKYLQGLSLNNEQYAKMIEKKDGYELTAYMDIFQQNMCEICMRLHNPGKYKYVYEDVYKWMLTYEGCFDHNDI